MLTPCEQYRAMNTSIRSLIDDLGGPRKVAGLVGVKVEAVYNAIRRERLPYRWRSQLIVETQRAGIKVDPALLGLADPAPSPEAAA